MIHHAPKILPVLAIVVAFLSIGLRTHPDTDHSQRRLSVRTNMIGSAFAEFSEKEKGTITAGKLADLVIINSDIFQIDPKEIEKVPS